MNLLRDLEPRRRRIAGAVAVAAAMTMVAAACGSSSKSAVTTPTSGSPSTTSGSQATSAPTSAPATGTAIKIGLMCSCSGPFGGSVTPVANYYRAWANSVNASGGLQGHPVQLDFKDDAATPGTSVSDVQALIADHVVAIADTSLVDQTWASAVQAANIPVVGIDLSNNTFQSNPDFYPEGQTNDSVTYSVAATAKAAGASNLGNLYCAEAPTCSQGVPLIRAAAKKLGVPLIYSAVISFTEPNYTAQCVAAQQAHVQSVLIGHSASVLAKVATDCARQGYKPIYIEEGLGFTNLVLSSTDLNRNLWEQFNNLPFTANTPAVQAMNTAVDKYYPGLRKSSNISELSAMAWISGVLLSDAVKAGGLTPSGTPSAAEIKTGLESLKADTLQGWSPPLTFAAGQNHSVDCWFTEHIQNGVPTLLNNGQTTCVTGSSS